MVQQTLTDRAIEIARKRGVARTRDFMDAGIPRVYLQRLQKQGRLNRIGHGLYQVEGAVLSGQHSLAEAARTVPHGVVCLLSALQFHGLTTQLPNRVWIMIKPGARASRARSVGLQFTKASGKSFTSGIKHHSIDGVAVPIYEPAKTVADCFKYRSKVGLDVAIEALRDCLNQRKCTPADLWRYAKTCRVDNIMRPYIEALT